VDLSRFVFSPTVTMIASKVIHVDKLEEAIEAQGLLDIADTDGTPLNNILAWSLHNERIGHGDLLPEYGGRFCYRSWAKGRPTDEYIENIMEMGHGSVLAHSDMTFQIIGVSRSFSHELVRHHVGTNYSQESQRYVDAKDVRFVVPPLIGYLVGTDDPMHCRSFVNFAYGCLDALKQYEIIQADLRAALSTLSEEDTKGRTLVTKRINEAARSVLPNATETRLVMSCNAREMRHIATLRGAEGADLEIRRWSVQFVEEARPYAPLVLKDFEVIDRNLDVDIMTSKYGAM